MEKPHGVADPELVLVPGDHVVIDSKNAVSAGTVIQAFQHTVIHSWTSVEVEDRYWCITYRDEDTGEICYWIQCLDGGILLSSYHKD